MSNFTLVINYDNGTESIITTEQFNHLKYMFSENSSFKHLTIEEYDRMELTHNAN